MFGESVEILKGANDVWWAEDCFNRSREVGTVERRKRIGVVEAAISKRKEKS